MAAKELTTSWKIDEHKAHSQSKEALIKKDVDEESSLLSGRSYQHPVRIVNSNLNFTLEDGKLVAVIGRVGSGKSSLLASLLGETHVQSGSLF